MPLAGRSEAFKRFLRTYEVNCVLQKQPTALTVVYFQNSDDKESAGDGDPKMLLEEFRNRYVALKLQTGQIEFNADNLGSSQCVLKSHNNSIQTIGVYG